MKLPIAVLMTAITIWNMSSASAMTVTAGEVWDLQFQNVPLVSSMYVGLGPQVTFTFGSSNPFDTGDSFVVDYFSDSLAASPDRSVTYTNSSGVTTQLIQNLAPEIFNPVLLNWNNDLQGAMRLTMLSGSLDLAPTRIEIWSSSNYFAGNYSFAPSPVPEPNSALLFAAAAPLLLWRLRSGTRKP